MVHNRVWAAAASVRYEQCDAMNLPIFIGIPNYFIKKRMERETVCDTSVHYSTEEEKSFNLACNFSTKTWNICRNAAVLRRRSWTQKTKVNRGYGNRFANTLESFTTMFFHRYDAPILRQAERGSAERMWARGQFHRLTIHILSLKSSFMPSTRKLSR